MHTKPNKSKMQSHFTNMADHDSFSDTISCELSEVDACKGLVNYPKALTKITKLTRPRLGSGSSPLRRRPSDFSSIEKGFLHGLSKIAAEEEYFDGWGTSFQETPTVSNKSVFAADASICTAAPSAVEQEYLDGWGTSFHISGDTPRQQ
jgi:hypothetical protein